MLWALIGLAATPPVGWLGGAALLEGWGRSRSAPGTWDAIVVPGCRVLPGGTPSTALSRRVRLAVALYEAGHAPRLVLTGGGRPSEAAVAAALAQRLGVPADACILEDRSTTTEENARFAREVAGPLRVLVATDAYHAWRCERVFRRHFPDAASVGVGVPADVALRMGLRELGSVISYAARGRL